MAPKNHGLVRLVWDEVEPGEWQAGGLGHLFSIIKNDAGTFAMRRRLGDEPSVNLGVFPTLQKAQFRAQRIVDGIQPASPAPAPRARLGAKIDYDHR